MSDSYNGEYWDQRVQKYLAEDWSHKPSPFAQKVAEYVSPGACILELGAGGGQDSVWFASKGHKVYATDATDVAFKEIRERSESIGVQPEFSVVDIIQPLPFPDSTFDVVYAQLVLHYFDDHTTRNIVEEIQRVLKPGGVLACMVNSTSDPEYDASQADSDGLINVNGLIKRFFTTETFKPFVASFEALLFDDNGRTPKDDAVGTSGMIQFIGKKA